MMVPTEWNVGNYEVKVTPGKCFMYMWEFYQHQDEGIQMAKEALGCLCSGTFASPFGLHTEGLASGHTHAVISVPSIL